MKPCCASIPIKDSPFPWKEPYNRPPLHDTNSHLDLLKKYRIPFIADIHTHFFPELIMKLIWKWFDKVNWDIACRGNDITRVNILNKNKVKYFTTLNYAHKKNMAESLNIWVYENMRAIDGAILFGTFYPEKGALDYVKKSIEEFGFKGFKLHLEVGKFNINESALHCLFQYLEKKMIPVVIHTGTAPLPGEYTGIHFFSKFMQSYPELFGIVAHMGASEVEEYASLLEIYPNLHLDTTMVFVDFFATGENTEEYLYLLKKYPDKILFGSDFPNIPYNYSHPVEKLLNSGLSQEILQKIFFRNFIGLPGILSENQRRNLERDSFSVD